MASFSEYVSYDGMGLAELIAREEVTAAQVCDAAVGRAQSLNPKLKAIIQPLYDYGQKAALAVDSDAPFAGVPFLLKDVHHALKGFPYWIKLFKI